MASDTRKGIVKGVSILSLAGIICKLIGLLYTVPLTRIIGSEGLGIYQSVYPTYNLLLTLSSAGLPVAVSRMVSQFLAKDDPKNAHHVFITALWLLTGLGCLCMILMLAGNGALVVWVREPRSSQGFYVIAPCLAIVCALSAFRGFMQGQQNMKGYVFSPSCLPGRPPQSCVRCCRCPAGNHAQRSLRNNHRGNPLLPE